ncbi:MAG: hypothetical protein ACYC3P_09250 [Bellilinea sp.]
MDLKVFIQQTLLEIIDGISEAQSHAREKKAIINAPMSSRTTDSVIYDSMLSERTYLVKEVEFDIALTVSDEDKAKGKIGVIAAVLNASVEGENNQINSTITRVKFTIPVLFPIDK